MLKIGIVAGEPSGDHLGADLVQSIKALQPDVELVGIGGADLQAQGCRSLFPMERLSVMGIVEVVKRLPELLGIRRALQQYFTEHRPDVFIGIDAPDFNLPLERYLRNQGIKTVHYVSPSVWAWRRGRLRGIARSVDLMLTLFPFEMQYYREHNIPALCSGHPLARSIPLTCDAGEARDALGLDTDTACIAILPGSRLGEINRIAPAFIEACQIIQRHKPGICFVAGFISSQTRELFEQIRNRIAPDLEVRTYQNRTRTVMAAADVVLVASGTATLEAMLVKRPMVVGYRVHWLTGWIARWLVKVPYVSLPNLLAGVQRVPEHLLGDCTAERLAKSVLTWLDDDQAREELLDHFREMHQQLLQPDNRQIAQGVLALVRKS